MKLTVLLQAPVLKAPHKNEISISTYNLALEIAKLVLVFFKTEAKLNLKMIRVVWKSKYSELICLVTTYTC